jgi:lipopolysaccharide biosynthesis glycosyltransferase
MKKYALCTVVDDNYFDGLAVMLYSLYKHNPTFKEYQFIIFDNGLSDKNKSIVKKINQNIIFKKIDYSLYKNMNTKLTAKQIWPSYYTLESFKLCKYYDKIIFIDSDFLILNNLDDLFKINIDIIGGCMVYSSRQDRLVDRMNCGLFILNCNNIGGEVYFSLIKETDKPNPEADQTVINRFFKNKITYIPKKFNIGKEHLSFKLNEAKTLHFVGKIKPWFGFEEKYKEQFNLWLEAKEELDIFLNKK